MPKRVKVGHLTSVHPPFDTRIFYKECMTLAAAGYEVVLIVPHDRSQEVDGVRIRAIPMPKGRRERMTCTTWKIFKAALAEDADVYHIHDPELLPWAQILRSLGKRVIYDMHENVPKAILSKFWIPAAIRRPISLVYGTLERLLMIRLPVVCAEKAYVADYQWVGKCSVVLNMPKVDQLLSIHERKYPIATVGYIGKVAPERGSLVTLEALRILKQRRHDVRWECIGPVSEAHRSELLRLAQVYGVEGVCMRGAVLPREGWRMAARCQIGLALLRPVPNYIESYPTKLFEYLALSLPVVVSDFPLYREVVGQARCGICVDPDDPGEVAEAIRWLLEHPQEAQAMGKRGQEAVYTSYNWGSEAEKLLELYRRIEEGK